MQPSDLQLLKEYDVWATAKILEQAAKLTPKQFTSVPEGGYASVRDTLVHTMSTEHSWRTGWETHERVAGLDPNDFPTCAAIAERWHVEDQKTRGLLVSVTEADLADDFASIGPLGLVTTHLMMHGMQHRTEVAMMLTAHGYSPGDIDLVFFLMEQAGEA